MHIESYLARIGIAQRPATDLRGLTTLHLAHLRAVPFENLHIHANEDIVLDDAWLHAKIVGRRRGGICYELNGAFAWLLRSIGFDVTIVAANVHATATELTPDFDHMALIVDIGGVRYLADVGFGDAFLVPLALEERAAQDDGRAAYAVSLDGGLYTVSRVRSSDPTRLPQPLYRFAPVPHVLDDFAARCAFHRTSPDSHFRRKRVCSRADGTGRMTLGDNELIVSHGERRTVETLASEDDVRRALRERFGIETAP